MPLIIFAHKNPRADNPSACHEGLGVTAGNLAETLVENGIQADTAPVVDGYHLRDKLAANAWPGLTHVIMCAPYMDTPFLEGLCRQFPSLKFATVYHSNVGFLQADNWAVKVMREQAALEKRIKNYHLAGNSDKFCQSVTGAYGVPCTYLPNLYFLHGPVARQRAPWKGPDLHIGIFGAIRQLKNLMTGVWASIQIGRDLEANTFIHISTGREEGGGNVLKGVHQMIDDTPLADPLQNVHLIHEPWRPWLEFRRFAVRRMDLLLQPSYTESFNGVTADGIAEGVPSVVSPAIDWVPDYWIANPDKAYEIAQSGIYLLYNRSKAEADGYRALCDYNLKGLKAWKDFLGIAPPVQAQAMLNLAPPPPPAPPKRSWFGSWF